MATVYTRIDAIARAKERRDRDSASYAVWQNIYNHSDYIVKTFEAVHPVNFRRVATAWSDGSYSEYQG